MRAGSRQRLNNLGVRIRQKINLENANHISDSTIPSGFVTRRLYLAGINWPPFLLISFSAITAFSISGLGVLIVPVALLPILFLVGATVPFMYLEGRIYDRACQFAAEYPAVLLAASSSLKAGMTPYAALERSIRLLPQTSLVRKEAATLLNRLENGDSRETAVHGFGQSIRLPELELFRTAFLLVLKHGGAFAPTLERLARVGRERSMLIRQAQVSTASMMMTANVLLIFTPIILGMLAGRTKDYWEILLQHPTANTLGAIGFCMITGSYLILRKMSAFRA